MSILSQRYDQIIEVEKIYNRKVKCNFCDGDAYFCNAVLHRRTKRCLLLTEPYDGYSLPKRHCGCKYNRDNFYTKLVILESDNVFVKARKMKEQKELMGFDYIKEQIRYPVPKSWYSYSFGY